MSTSNVRIHVNLKFDTDFYTDNVEPLQHNRVLSKLISNLLKLYFENEAFRDMFNTYNEAYRKEIKKYIDEIEYKKSNMSSIVNMFNYVPIQKTMIAPTEGIISTSPVIGDTIINTVDINSQQIELPTSSIESTVPSVDNKKTTKEEPKAPPLFYKFLESAKNHKDTDINSPITPSNNDNEEVKREKPKVPAAFTKFIKSM